MSNETHTSSGLTPILQLLGALQVIGGCLVAVSIQTGSSLILGVAGLVSGCFSFAIAQALADLRAIKETIVRSASRLPSSGATRGHGRPDPDDDLGSLAIR